MAGGCRVGEEVVRRAIAQEAERVAFGGVVLAVVRGQLSRPELVDERGVEPSGADCAVSSPKDGL